MGLQSLVLACLLTLAACSDVGYPPEADAAPVEASVAPEAEASQPVAQEDAGRGQPPPWPCCDPPAGGPLPHPIR